MRYHENSDFQLPPTGEEDFNWWSAGSSHFDTVIEEGGVSLLFLIN